MSVLPLGVVPIWLLDAQGTWYLVGDSEDLPCDRVMMLLHLGHSSRAAGRRAARSVPGTWYLPGMRMVMMAYLCGVLGRRVGVEQPQPPACLVDSAERGLRVLRRHGVHDHHLWGWDTGQRSEGVGEG